MPARSDDPRRPSLLLMVPTELERERLLQDLPLPAGCAVELAGFGPPAAAARTAERLAALRPAYLILAGIAGALGAAGPPIGTAHWFGSARLDGVGAGQGAKHLGPRAMGLAQWSGEPNTPIYDTLELSIPDGAHDSGELLTVCAASFDAEEAQLRHARFPRAVAEDMECFGTALAGALCGTRVACLRGISNVAGNRDPSSWKIDEALDAVRAALIEFLPALSIELES